MDQILCFLSPKEKGSLPLKTTFATHCRFWPSSRHKPRELIHPYYEIVFWHGPPQRFLTDCGTNFTSKLKTQLCSDLNINKVFTSSYHPQCDGFVERINGIIIQLIPMYVASYHKDWDTYLPSATYAYNTSLSETTGDTPFFPNLRPWTIETTWCCVTTTTDTVKLSGLSPRMINSTNKNS